MSFPSFSTGEVLTAADMNAVGLWRNTTCTVTSAGGTAATASNGVITIGTGNTSVTVANAFSADYDNYRIIITGGTASAGGSVGLQLNNSTGTTYQVYGYFGNFGTATLNGYGPAAAVRWSDAILSGTTRYFATIDLFRPHDTVQTFGTAYSASQIGAYNFALYDSSTNSSTGFVLTPGTGTLTGGVIRVYGYRD